MSAIDDLTKQILGQNTTDKWSGGYGPENSSRAMAKLLADVGITDIRQFGKVPNYESVELVGHTLNGKDIPLAIKGRYYEPVWEPNPDGGMSSVPRYLSAEEVKQLQPRYAQVIKGGADDYGIMQETITPVDSATVKFVDGKTLGVIGTTFGNKETGQPIVRGSGRWQSQGGDDLFSGTGEGSGNTGYRVQFNPDGSPVFYTTAGSSRDSFLSDIAPVLGLGLAFVPGLQGVAASLGTALGASAAVAPALGNAIIRGALAEATGGDFLKGAALSAVGSFVPGVNTSISDALGGGAVADMAAGSLTGGALSSLAGGDFTQGALIGGAGAGIKGLESDLRQEQFDTAMTESGLAGQTATSPSDFIQEPVTVEPPTINEIINSLQPFKPDYSLSSPEMVPGLKPDVIDTSGYQIGSEDYSLGDMANADVVDGFGLTPNLSAPIGDPNSFINQPAPQINYTLPEFTDLPPVDNSAELAALGVAKTLLPAAIAAIAANNAAPEEAAPTGFGIVPIPGDWRSPEYNQQFTPSAPIDFGSLELLRGTQFENPAFQPQTNYSLSDVINSMNNQSMPFVQQYQIPMQSTVGNNDIIGSLNGNQVSIADIIAGIQSQYGQKTSS
jgi:hypothetical protein